ncbi:MAG TPA: hypothetical protein VHE61_05195 [Opitutaceae bacterium]|nr:hypothetical protein [Opitutaceae bacterium]
MPASSEISAPALAPERFADRLAEAIRLAGDPAGFAALPRWTQRVMLILKDQLIPPEFASIFTAEHALLGEGVCVAWIAHAREAITDAAEGPFARRVAEWLTRAPQTSAVVNQLSTGEIAQAPEFRDYVMRRLFAESAAERRAFAEGLALGNRVHDLFARHAGQKSTDATRVYLLLWLYWPEISRLRSIREAARTIEELLGPNRNLAGRHWEERFRKIANRIGLSYRGRPARPAAAAGRKRPPATA